MALWFIPKMWDAFTRNVTKRILIVVKSHENQTGLRTGMVRQSGTWERRFIQQAAVVDARQGCQPQKSVANKRWLILEADTLRFYLTNYASQKGLQTILIVRSVVQRLITHLVVAINSHQLRHLQKLPVQHGTILRPAAAQGFNFILQNGLHTTLLMRRQHRLWLQLTGLRLTFTKRLSVW